MKKIKSKKTTRYFLIFILFFTVSQCLLGQTITGASEIYPETYTYYSRATASTYAYNDVWFCNDPNVILIPNGDAITIKVNLADANCNFTLSYIEKQADNNYNPIGQFQHNYVIKILPHIILPTIYPGETINISVQDNCSHNGCNYLWNVSPAGACPSCGPTGISTQAIYIDPNAIPTSINVNCTMSNCSPIMSSTALDGVSALIKLRNSSVTGPNSIGCIGSQPAGSIIYVASNQNGATYFNWSWPGFMTYVTGQGTDHLTLIENAIGTGNIQLQTSNGFGSPGIVQSGVINYPIQICCRTQLNITSNVNSPNIDKQQSGINLDASNIINNGASAMYHAGTEVKLSNGFSAIQGSYFHGYIENCTGVFNRMLTPNNDTKTQEENPINIYNTNSSENTSINSKNDFLQNDLNVYPNPNNGEFNLALNRNFELPISIKIKDVFGKEVESILYPKEYEQRFDLKNITNGIYFINVSYSDKTLSKKIIKN